MARTKNPKRPRKTARGAKEVMSLLAAIDVGSHALRLGIGEIGHGPVRMLETLHAPVAIGLDTFSRGGIRSSTTEAVVSTLRDFVAVLRGYGIEPAAARAVATTAVRDARNRDVFLDRIEQGCGLRIEVIEAIEETRLMYQFVRHLVGPGFEQGTCMLLSLGAGGTQILIQRDGEVAFSETRQFGMLQLWGSRPTDRAALLAARSRLRKEVRSIQRIHDLAEATGLIVINNEIHQLLERLAEVRHGAAGLEVERQELLRLHGRIDRLPTDELQTRSGLDHGTAEMARVALEELMAFSAATSAKTITVPGASLLDCLLLDAQLRREGAAGPGVLAQQVQSAALALGRKYRFDEAHSRQVQRLALQLFDALRRFTHLGEDARLHLSVAALLHDIGYFVSPHAHERHSSYLIAASEIIGLSRPDIDRIAHVARYHRRPFAEVDTFELTRLAASDRVAVLKLAALLRVADALDDDRQQRVDHVDVELTPEALRIFAETRAGDRQAFSSIAASFKVKADLFGEIFGLEPMLTEVLAR